MKREQEDLRGKRAVVMGLGLFSGGVEATRWLVARGAQVIVTDLKEAGALTRSVEALDGLPVTFHLGGHSSADFERAAIVVASPAVPRDHPLLLVATRAGARVETEVNLFLRACPAIVTAVTGSNGKSTTATLLASILRAAGRTVHLGGNIGRALINEAASMKRGDDVVLEISSFQLEWTRAGGLHPTVGVITNVTANHLDRHGTFEEYVEAKAAVLPPPGAFRGTVASWDDPWARSLGERSKAHVLWTGVEVRPPGESVTWMGDRLVHRGAGERTLLHRADVALRGEINLRNVASAAGAAILRGVPADAVLPGVKGFTGLPHRLEGCGAVGGITCINDSKATTPEATMHALRAIDGPLGVIVGGHDKQVDLGPLARALAARTRLVVLLGETAERMERLLWVEQPAPPAQGPQVIRVNGIEEAVAAALEPGRLPEGSTLLLSPGHASYGMFSNYEERGDRFRAAVRARADGGG